MNHENNIALFQKFPSLKENIPFHSIGNYPTPLKPLKHVSKSFQSNIWIKDDAKTSIRYGGNKVRKLEFLLADALKKKTKRIITLGGIGSNHIVATGIYARELGMQTEGFVYCQPLIEHVRENILLATKYGIRLHLGGSYLGMIRKLAQSYGYYAIRDHHIPYIITPGGSCALGVLGYVNAAIELYEQTNNNTKPKIDVIFVAVGTCGTFAGLLLAKWLFRHSWKIIGVRVTPKSVANNRNILRMIYNTYHLLQKHIHHLPKLSLPLIPLIDSSYGNGYGHPLDQHEFMRELLAQDNIDVEPIYTGKMFDALQKYATQRNEESIVFWNTYFGDVHTSNIFSEEVSSDMKQFVTDNTARCFCIRKLFNRKECPMLYNSSQTGRQ